ncbi:MAG: BREX protein BrxB domain-containing protein [Bacteroidota bacterium]
MTITELYNKLSDKEFQDPETGNLFFNAYMYIYNPEKEYEIRNEILTIKDRLHRPNNYLDVLVLNIFDEFCEYLKNKKFGKNNMFDFFLEKEQDDPKKTLKSLSQESHKDEFFRYVNDKINDHLNSNKQFEKAYIFVYGFGQIFPYLRASKFLNNFEKYITGKYKIIMFFPGTAKSTYSLFDLLNDENPYRSIKLINEPV